MKKDVLKISDFGVSRFIERDTLTLTTTTIIFILKTYESDESYWLQFEDTEIMAKMATLLCPAANDPELKIKLFDICLSSSISANRWDALRELFNNIIMKWDNNSITPYSTYRHEHSNHFIDLSKMINVTIPSLVHSYYP